MQTKIHSALEAFVNILTGALIAWTFTQTVGVYIIGVDISPGQNVILTICLTLVSIARSYLWRRYFNGLTLKRYKDLNKGEPNV